MISKEQLEKFFKWKMNPCDIDHYDFLTPVQRFFEIWSWGTDCKCCLGARIFFALVAGIIIGASAF